MSSEWTTVAVLNRPRGNKGELTATCLSSKPERFADLRSVHLFGAGEAFEVENIWDHDGAMVFKFRGVDSISDAEKLRGAEVRDRASDRLIGKVTGWEEYGGPALLEVDDGRLLIPFVKAICVDIRPDQRLIRVDLPEGLEQLTEPRP